MHTRRPLSYAPICMSPGAISVAMCSGRFSNGFPYSHPDVYDWSPAPPASCPSFVKPGLPGVSWCVHGMPFSSS